MRLPDWFVEYHEVLVSLQLPIKQVKQYIVNHDCGKHLCEVIDEDNRVHYPNHADVSADYWREHSDDELVGKLIRNDMFFHTCKAVDLKETPLSKRELATLLVTSLSEIHANAEMFGGIESQSFKIKYKQIERRGKSFVKDQVEEAYKGYVYCFVRTDLPESQKAVQLSHVCMESERKFRPDRHPSLVAIAIKKKKIGAVIQECLDNEIDFTIFRDNIFDNEVTAIATEPLYSVEDREVFKRYSLL